VLEAIETPTQYFRWAGADDIMEPELLQTMVDVLDSRPEVVAVMPDMKNIDDRGAIIGSMSHTLDLQSSDVYERARDVLMASYQHVVAYGLLRASTLRDMRTGPNHVGWDPTFIWELASRGRVVQTSGPALLRRFHAGSISRVKTVKEMRKWVEPNAAAGMGFPNWTWAYERLRALFACRMSAPDRLRVGTILARYTMWHRLRLLGDVTQAARRALRLSDEDTF
jgi:hypothetical protein